MPKTTTISPDEPASTTLGGGYPAFPNGVSTAAPGSEFDTIKKKATGGSGSLNKSLPTSRTVSMTASQASGPAAPGGIEADIAKFNTPGAIDEVTTDSSYYQPSQPFLHQFIMEFAKSVDEATVTTGITTPFDPKLSAAPGSEFEDNSISSSVNSIEPTFDESQSSFLEFSQPNHFLGLEFKRIFNGVGYFTITLFDPKWDEVEKRLIKSKGFFKFWYGYMGTDRLAATSPAYVAKTLSYKIVDFGMEGSTIVLSGLTTGYSLTFSKTCSALNLKGELISDIAQKICNDLCVDYIPIIERTAPVKTREGLDTTDEVNKLLNLTGETYFKVIINQLLKYAVNEKGQGNYVFFIRTTKDGTNEFHFHTMNYDPKNSSTVAIPTFTKFRTKNTALMNFNPSWSMAIAQLTGGGSTTSVVIDMVDKSISVQEANMNLVPQKMDNKAQITLFDKKDYLPKDLQTDTVLSSFNYKNIAARSDAQHKTVVDSDFSRSYPGAITASLEIVGTPNFYLTQKIAVFIFKPQGNNITATTSNVHWISGFFRIIGITDKIVGGKYTTVLSLVSDGRGQTGLDPVKSLPPETSSSNTNTNTNTPS